MSDLISGPDLDESIRQARSLIKGSQSQKASKTGVRMDQRQALEDAAKQRFKVFPSHLFYVEVSGLGLALFSGVSGIGMSREVETVREGGKNDQPHHFPGQVQYNNITLTHGLTTSRDLIDWFMCGLYDLDVKRLNLTIYQGTPGVNGSEKAQSAGQGAPFIRQWDIGSAYPVRWQLTDLSAKDSDSLVFESVELAFDSIRLTMGS